MTELEVCLLAVAVGTAAALAAAPPAAVVVATVVLAVLLRRPVLVALALSLLAGGRAHAALAALDPPPPHAVSAAVVTVMSDPVSRFGRWEAEVRRAEHGAVEHDLATFPASVAPPRVGERWRVAGRVRPLEATPWSTARHLRARLTLTRAERRDEPGAVLAAANAARDALVGGASSLGDLRPLFAGLVLGDDRDQPPEQVSAFRLAGLAHLLAVSGQNVAFVLVAASPLLRRVPGRARWVATVAVLGAFVLATRWEPSVLRAVAMSAVVATARARGRLASPVRALALAVTGLVVIDPLLVRSAGFQLSVAACAALAVGAGPAARRLPGPRWFREALGATAVAQAGTLPLLFAAGAQLSLASVPANLLAVPVAGAVMVWGLTAGGVAALAPPLAPLLHAPTRLMVWWIDRVAAWASAPSWPRLTPWLAVSLLVACVAWGWRRRSMLRALAAVAVVAGLVAAVAAGPESGRCGPVATATRGGATVVAAPGGTTVRALLDCLTLRRVVRIDLLVLWGGGASPTEQAAAVRSRHEVRAVWAAPGRVRGADRIAAGRWQVGAVEVRVRGGPAHWEVEVG